MYKCISRGQFACAVFISCRDCGVFHRLRVALPFTWLETERVVDANGVAALVFHVLFLYYFLSFDRTSAFAFSLRFPRFSCRARETSQVRARERTLLAARTIAAFRTQLAQERRECAATTVDAVAHVRARS